MKTFSKLFLVLGLLTGQAVFAQDFEPDNQVLDVDEIINGSMLRAHRGGNGGNSIASEFSVIAKNAATAWDALCQERDTSLCEELPGYKELLNKETENFVTVLSAPEVRADDGEVREAVNFVAPGVNKSYIIVSEDKWARINEGYYTKDSRKINLILHEYFSLMGLESSDYYAYSSDLYGELERANFDISKIAKNTNMNPACSVAVSSNGTVDKSKVRDIQSKMGQLGYDIKQEATKARYNLRVSQDCTGFFFSKTCSVYVEMEDSFKTNMEIAYTKHATEKGIGSGSAANKAFSMAFEELPACK